MKLPVPGPAYDPRNEASARTLIEQADSGNVKLGADNTLSGWLRFTHEASITAHAGGTKASARVLTKTVNHVGTCATAGDSLLLPPAKAGEFVVIAQMGAKDAQVYGQGSDTIDDVATATGITQNAGLVLTYWCPIDGKWYASP